MIASVNPYGWGNTHKGPKSATSMDLKVWGLLSFGKYWQYLSREAANAFFQQWVKVGVVSQPPVFGVCIWGRGEGGSSSNRFVFLLLSRWIMSDSLWPHGLQHARLPCPSLSPRACSDSCPLSQSCYRPISSSVALFSCCLQYFPASGSLPTGAWCSPILSSVAPLWCMMCIMLMSA